VVGIGEREREREKEREKERERKREKERERERERCDSCAAANLAIKLYPLSPASSLQKKEKGRKKEREREREREKKRTKRGTRKHAFGDTESHLSFPKCREAFIGDIFRPDLESALFASGEPI
jgi:hypothetical protein